MKREPLRIVTFKWEPMPGYRSAFNAECVNVLANMIARNYRGDYEFICVTDDDRGIDRSISIEPMWDDHAHVASPHGGKQPACYRRLKLFSPWALKHIGERIVCLDLDTIIVGDMTEQWDRDDEFVIWGGRWDGRNHNQHYNGSMFLMRAGTRTQVWDRFDPQRSPREALLAGYRGSDQGWINFVLGSGEQMFTREDGIYSWRVDIKPRGGVLPPNARMIMFHGVEDPWSTEPQRHSWVREHWR
jgi:hypothetical protein